MTNHDVSKIFSEVFGIHWLFFDRMCYNVTCCLVLTSEAGRWFAVPRCFGTGFIKPHGTGLAILKSPFDGFVLAADSAVLLIFIIYVSIRLNCQTIHLIPAGFRPL